MKYLKYPVIGLFILVSVWGCQTDDPTDCNCYEIEMAQTSPGMWEEISRQEIDFDCNVNSLPEQGDKFKFIVCEY